MTQAMTSLTLKRPMTHHEKAEIVTAAAKAAPPVAVSGLTVAGLPLQDWVLLLTAIYTLAQLFVLVRDRLVQRKRAADCPRECAAPSCPDSVLPGYQPARGESEARPARPPKKP